MQSLGHKIRRHRHRLAMSLDDLSAKIGISKAYLSLIENGRVLNPPSDEKLRRLENGLGFAPGELVSQANVERTPRDVRAVLHRLIQQGQAAGDGATPERSTALAAETSSTTTENPSTTGKPPAAGVAAKQAAFRAAGVGGPVNLDDAYLSGVLQELVDRGRGNVEPMSLPGGRAVPVINKVSAGYPSDFTDLSYPPRVADQYLSAPGLDDADAFACRVHGDSMTPKYAAGDIVVFSPAAAWKEGADCFVRFDDGQTTFKRAYTEAGEGGESMIRLQPRNDRYRPQVVPREQVAGMYRAVYVYRAVDEG